MQLPVPEKTTVNQTRFEGADYVLPLAPELIPLTEAGYKGVTYRYGDRYAYLRPDDVVRIQNSGTAEFAGSAVITAIGQILFKDLPLTGNGHEEYTSREHMRDVISGYYAFLGRAIADGDIFTEVRFEMLPQDTQATPGSAAPSPQLHEGVGQ